MSSLLGSLSVDFEPQPQPAPDNVVPFPVAGAVGPTLLGSIPASPEGQPRGLFGITLALLANREMWVPWQTEQREGGKPTKVPYRADGSGARAKADDPRTWGTRADAEMVAARLPKPFGMGGVGLQFKDLGFGLRTGGVDLDTLRNVETGEFDPRAQEIIDRFGSYSEVSPSQGGGKIIFTYRSADLEILQEVMGTKTGRQWKQPGSGDHPPGIALFLCNRFFAITDQQIDGTPIELRTIPTEDLIWLITTAGPAFAAAADDDEDFDEEPEEVTAEQRQSGDNSRSGHAFRLAVKMKRKGAPFEEYVEALYANPKTKDWAKQKGEQNDGREFKRAWDRADSVKGKHTEDAAALIFAARFRDRLRYCHHTGSWFEWDGSVWREEETELAFSWARNVCRDVGGLSKAAHAAAVERFARADRAFAVTSAIWDQDPFLLGTPAGTVDLRTGRLRPAVQRLHHQASRCSAV